MRQGLHRYAYTYSYMRSLSLGLLSLGLSLLYIQLPSVVNYDEVYYVPAAREFLEGRVTRNLEHPPVAKYLIAESISLLGDHPLGWRAASAVAGAVTVALIDAIAIGLGAAPLAALFATLITLLNILQFVQSRIAMLDTFMMMFALGGIAALISASKSQRTTFFSVIAGGCFGCSLACKWSGLWILLPSFLYLLFALKKHWVSRIKALGILGFSTLLAYMICFIPLFGLEEFPYGFAEFFKYQHEMYSTQARYAHAHRYASVVWQWLLLLRPIWYHYTGDAAAQSYRGILCFTNPAVAWTGLVATLVCLAQAFRQKSLPHAFVVGLFIIPCAIWILLPRPDGFYYYLYPSIIALSWILVFAFQASQWFAWFAVIFSTGLVFRAACPLEAGKYVQYFPILSGVSAAAAWVLKLKNREKDQDALRFKLELSYLLCLLVLFIYFYPIFSGVKNDLNGLWRRMWLSSWI